MGGGCACACLPVSLYASATWLPLFFLLFPSSISAPSLRPCSFLRSPFFFLSQSPMRTREQTLRMHALLSPLFCAVVF